MNDMRTTNKEKENSDRFKLIEQELHDLKGSTFRMNIMFENFTENLQKISENLNLIVVKLERQGILEERLSTLTAKVAVQEADSKDLKNKVIFVFISLIISLVLMFVRAGNADEVKTFSSKTVAINPPKQDYGITKIDNYISKDK